MNIFSAYRYGEYSYERQNAVIGDGSDGTSGFRYDFLRIIYERQNVVIGSWILKKVS
jgi:hypothetical protein